MIKTSKNNPKKTIVTAACLLIIIILIKLASFYPNWIERYYSQGVYTYISRFFRIIFGWLPFSIGDVFYFGAGLYLLVKFILFVRILIKKQYGKLNFRSGLIKTLFILAAVYIYFNVSWGLNYNRPGIAAQLQLQAQTHNADDLQEITGILLQKVNENRRALGSHKINYKPHSQVFDQADTAYQTIAKTYPFLTYRAKSVKRSMYGTLGNLLGISGYYNPFSGEAQLNLTQPRFIIPFVTCHEIAHQLGYASESEASFVGYLAAIQSKDTLFHYSAYFDLFSYANRELGQFDSLTAKNNYNQLDPLVKADAAELREHWRRSDNVIEPIIRIFYDHYLKANQQAKGVKSYNEVIGWLIAYHKKYGPI